jgi:16S rRNA A1518/A1519 N6-dimethyltransferase RsmA/KsgA/DIM1 with predicted DNA glycosylase/AP lyase activity
VNVIAIVLLPQWEVAQRLIAKPRTKDYGILSVVFQLYTTPRVAFKIPPTAFYPVPKVDSALVTLDFPRDRPPLPVDTRDLRAVVSTSFRQRRKMLRVSLKPLLAQEAALRAKQQAAQQQQPQAEEQGADDAGAAAAGEAAPGASARDVSAAWGYRGAAAAEDSEGGGAAAAAAERPALQAR